MDKLRDTPYATESARAVYKFPTPGAEARIERMLFKAHHNEGYRFSWWVKNRMMLKPLDGSEDEILGLMQVAISNGVFTQRFCKKLRRMLAK